jgi:hypothetical protein
LRRRFRRVAGKSFVWRLGENSHGDGDATA